MISRVTSRWTGASFHARQPVRTQSHEVGAQHQLAADEHPGERLLMRGDAIPFAGPSTATQAAERAASSSDLTGQLGSRALT